MSLKRKWVPPFKAALRQTSQTTQSNQTTDTAKRSKTEEENGGCKDADSSKTTPRRPNCRPHTKLSLKYRKDAPKLSLFKVPVLGNSDSCGSLAPKDHVQSPKLDVTAPLKGKDVPSKRLFRSPIMRPENSSAFSLGGFEKGKSGTLKSGSWSPPMCLSTASSGEWCVQNNYRLPAPEVSLVPSIPVSPVPSIPVSLVVHSIPVPPVPPLKEKILPPTLRGSSNSSNVSYADYGDFGSNEEVDARPRLNESLVQARNERTPWVLQSPALCLMEPLHYGSSDDSTGGSSDEGSDKSSDEGSKKSSDEGSDKSSDEGSNKSSDDDAGNAGKGHSMADSHNSEQSDQSESGESSSTGSECGSASDTSDEVSALQGYHDDNCTWRQILGSDYVENDAPLLEDIITFEIDDEDPASVFRQFLTDDLLKMISRETNRYAKQFMRSNPRITDRLKKWVPTNPKELLVYFGINMLMGLVSLPEVEMYWSKKHSDLYNCPLIKSAMTRDRYQIITRFLHFSDNTASTARTVAEKRLQKLGSLVDMLNENFQAALTPGSLIVIDESLFPWRGRLSFRQYIPSKSNRYGIKLYKMCTPSAYTLKMKIYTGSGTVESNKRRCHSHAVVMSLMEDHLDEGRTLFVDNFYTGVPLAEELMKRDTNIVGTVAVHRKGLPKPLLNQELQRGQSAGMICSHGVRVIKWQDKKTITMLSTVKHHTESLEDTGRFTRGPDPQPIFKPHAVLEYNIAKKGVDVADQLLSYYKTDRKGLKWYRKLAISMITGISVINAFVIVSTSRPTHLVSFTEILGRSLLKEGGAVCLYTQPRTTGHRIAELGGPLRVVGRRCVVCYQDKRVVASRKRAQNVKKVRTYCTRCPNQPSMCIPCFNKSHRS